jgi:hypothetical protein
MIAIRPVSFLLFIPDMLDKNTNYRIVGNQNALNI